MSNTHSNSGAPQRPRRSFNELMSQMQGKWPDFFQSRRPQLVENYSGSSRDDRKHFVCPVHGGKDGFRFYKDFATKGGVVCNSCGSKANGVVTLAWFDNTSTKEATKEVGEWLDGGTGAQLAAAYRPAPAPEPPKTYEWEKEQIRSAMTGCTPIHGTPAERYLRVVRKLPTYAIAYHRLRYHPGLEYFHDSKSHGLVPALVALYRAHAANNVVRTLHKVHIDENGNKAKVPEVKKSMKVVETMNGAAVPLFDPEHGVLAVTEGLETAGAVRAGTFLPCWATLTGGQMERMDLVEGVELYLIFADKDASETGYIAAHRLAAKVIEAGKKALVFFPPQDIPEGSKGVDWHDTWIQMGSAGFPEDWRYNRRTDESHWLSLVDQGIDVTTALVPSGSQDPKLHDVTEAVERKRARVHAQRLQREAELAKAEELASAVPA